MDQDDYNKHHNAGDENGFRPSSMVSDEMASLLQLAAWWIVPDLVTNWTLSLFHRVWYSGQRSSQCPLPNTPQWITQRKRAYALVIILYLAYSVYSVLMTRPINYYELMGVPPNLLNSDSVSSNQAASIVRSQFRQLSLIYHPDKNPTPQALDMFTQLQGARSVLEDPSARHIHNLLGPGIAERCRHTDNDRRRDRQRQGSGQVRPECADYGELVRAHISHSLITLYLVWAGIIGLMSLFKSSTVGTYWRLTGLLGLAILDLTVITDRLPVTIVQLLHEIWWTPNDLSQFTHKVFPLVFIAVNQLAPMMININDGVSVMGSELDELLATVSHIPTLIRMADATQAHLQETAEILWKPLIGVPSSRHQSGGKRDLREMIRNKVKDEVRDRVLCMDDQYANQFQTACREAMETRVGGVK